MRTANFAAPTNHNIKLMNSPRIVLVNPSHPGNIGAAARAIKNMGFSELALVKPRRGQDLSPEAYARAAGADDILDQALHFDTLSDALADCHVCFGTSARNAVDAHVQQTPRLAAETIAGLEPSYKVAMVFGREHAGLTNDELRLCQYHIQIPCNPDFSSLNLGAAVQLICYELHLALHQATPTITQSVDYADQRALDLYYEHLEQLLSQINFLKADNPRQLMPKLQRLYQRAQLSSAEVHMLRGILTATQKKLRLQDSIPPSES